MQKLLVIACGGAIGALLRYAVSGFTHKLAHGVFPWGTLAVNLIGCFLIGFLWILFERFAAAPNMRSMVFIGFLGAFTTFSTYGLESVSLLQDGEIKYGIFNILSSNIFGILLVLIGIFAARYLIDLLR